ncbi:hypothetical protein ACFWXK_24995 [Streptomyces sp. NPDC059070]|uniref:hypothetical protein n=1 Tax=Streptomyces sp. NPDC059070 TaxID=3346713 RepID=UPI0036D04347
MNSDHDLLWRHCVHLGRLLLPMADQQEYGQARRHDTLRAWDIQISEGEYLLEVFAALAAHAAAVEATSSAAEFASLPLSAVADAATGKQDIELLAGLPRVPVDPRDEKGVALVRLYAHTGGTYSHRLFRLSRELHSLLMDLATHEQRPARTCGDLFRQAAAAGLHQ